MVILADAGGRLGHIDGLVVALIDAARDGRQHLLSLLPGEVSVLYGDIAVNVQGVGIPIAPVHRTRVPPIPISLARLAKICP